MTTLMTERADADALRQCVEGIVHDRYGGRSAIVGVHRQRFECSSSYACDLVTVELATGDELQIFLKDFGVSYRPKDGPRQRRERELRVYRDVLTETDLGTATYYGSVWDASGELCWLLLEFVDGMRLHGLGGADYWMAAAGWLGRMQHYCAQQGVPRLDACDSLLRHDARFFWSKAERAVQVVSHISPPVADRLAHILTRYDKLVDTMASQPPNLVHGSYTSRNIVVDLGAAPPRVCPTSWGLAALGTPLYDLAFLADSCDPATLDRLWNAYEAEARGCGLPLPNREDMRYVVDCFRLHKIIQSLSESLERGFTERTVSKLVDRGERLSSLILLQSRKSEVGSRKSEARPTSDERLPTSGFRPADHPAAGAWQASQSGRGEPASVETLKEAKKSAVYRLKGVRPGGAAVIAKRCAATTAALERTIYEDILPHVPITALHYYGCTEHDGDFCWLFLEDAGEQRYSPYRREQYALAGRWLGLLHTSAARLAPTAGLPDRGPGHYLEHLRSARHTILRNLTNPALSGEDVTVLHAIVAQCDVLEAHWSQVETCCAGIPSTLVHGDFRPKNVHVRADQAGLALFPLDWETAGWGVPAPDLARVDLTAYWSVVRECWPTLHLRAIQHLAHLGKVFRWLAAVRWESMAFEYEGPARPINMASMRVCHDALSDAIQAVQWTE